MDNPSTERSPVDFTYWSGLTSGFDPHDYATEGTYLTGGLLPSAVGPVVALGWYRSEAGPPGPTNLSLWHQSQQSRIVSIDSPNDDGSVGWQWTDCIPTKPLNSASLVVGCHGPNGFKIAERSGTPAVKAEMGFDTTGSLLSWRKTGSDDKLSGGSSLTPIYALDLKYSTEEALSAGGITAGDVDAKLASYLTAAGANYSGSPLADIHTVTEDTYNQTVDNNTAITALQTDTTTLLTRLSQAWADTIGSNTEGIPGFLTAWDAFYTQFVDITAPAVADLVDAIGTYTGITVFSYLAALIRFANGIDAPPQLAEGPNWQLFDEADFVDNLLWPVEADVYRVTLSAFDPAGTSEPVGTETRHAYLIKWCPFNVQFSSEWHYANTASADLYLGGRMPGLGLILYHGGSGHVQAWRRTEAP